MLGCISVRNMAAYAAVLIAAMGLTNSCSTAETAAKKTPAPATDVRSPATAAVPDSAAQQAPAANQRLVVYYFHGNARCPTCLKLENFAKSEVQTVFADAIKKGMLEWKTVNVDVKGNEHFAQDYKLYTKSVVISIRQDGKESKWKNLDQIWQLVHSEGTYREYIRKEVGACLEGKCL